MAHWRDVAGYEGRYQVNRAGQVLSLVSSRVLCPGRTSAGYLTVNLRRDGASRSHYVHVLVAIAFIPNPEGKPTVNHKDGVRSHNRRRNLEWATYGENHAHSYRELGRTKYRQTAVRCSDGRCFVSIKDAAKAVGVSAASLSDAIRRRGRSAGLNWSLA